MGMHMTAVLKTQKLYKEWICIYSKEVCLSVFLSVWMAAPKAVFSYAPNIKQIASLSLMMMQTLTVLLEAPLRNLHISAFHQAASATSQACAFKMTCPDLWMTDWTFLSLIFSTLAFESQGSLRKPWWNHALPFLNSGTTSKNII